MKKRIKNMKDGKSAKNGRKMVRTTISISDDVSERGHERMRNLRHRSFSHYIEDLIASDIGDSREAVAA